MALDSGLTTSLPVIGLKAFPAALVGGLDSLAGALVGALIVAAAEVLLIYYVDPLLSDVVPFLVLIAMGEQIPEDAPIVLGILYNENAFLHANCLCSCTRTGTTMLKVEPTPRVESKSIRPPCIPTSWREIDNPSPVPPFFRVLVLSICWNCSNIVA